MNYPKRLIEVDLPISRVSTAARAEKDSRLGHIPRLHIYPAARPTGACRAVLLATLWPDPADSRCPQHFRDAAVQELTAFANNASGNSRVSGTSILEHATPESFERWLAIAKNPSRISAGTEESSIEIRNSLLDFIADFAVWDNATHPAYLSFARNLSLAATKLGSNDKEIAPVIVDPFAGGGAFPLEASRIGGQVFATDQSPLAILLNKVLLEHVPKYGERLSESLDKWCDEAQKLATKTLSEYYPSHPDGLIPIAYLWARTVVSEAPDGSNEPVEIPMIRSMWLTRKKGRNLALRWKRNVKGDVETKSVTRTYSNGQILKVRQPQLEVFEPRTSSEVEKGTASRSSATCPVTGFTTPAKNVTRQLASREGGASDARMYCVVLMNPNAQGRVFRIPLDSDISGHERATAELSKLARSATDDLPLIPDEKCPVMSGVFNAPLYGHSTWGSLFTSRQLLALTTYLKAAKVAAARHSAKEPDFARAFASVLAIAIDRLADLNASLCVWQLNTPNTAHVFGRWALPMVMDFGEVNPLAGAGGSPESAIRRISASLNELNASVGSSGIAERCSAKSHFLPDDICDVVVTDPPYYNAVPYADLADFFYVWLKRILREYEPALFATDLTPKDDEICEMAGWDSARYAHKDKTFFEKGMTDAFKEVRRYLKPSGVAVIVFAHKSTSGWEALLQAIVDAKLVITSSWPIDTEMESRLRAKNSAVLASSIHIVVRPRENPDGSIADDIIGEWRDVLGELPSRIKEWMPRLAAEGIVGADAIFACIGPALEIFSRYSHVEKANGEAATLREYLEHVWAAVSTEALSLIFKDAQAAGLEPDARLSAMWLWTIGGGGTNGKMKKTASDESTEEEESTDDDDDEESSSSKGKAAGGFLLEYDAARKIAQGLGVHLEQCESLVEVKGDKARLLSVAERTAYLFGKGTEAGAAGKGRKKKPQQKTLFGELDEAESADAGWTAIKGPPAGATVLDRVHQAMILFAANRGELLKRFLVEDGVGKDARFWKLADNLNKLYPPGTDERRWVEGVLARKKGLGL